MIIVGWLFKYYKLFYRKIFRIVFIFIKKFIIFICANDIEEILKSDRWINLRSILFFYTNIIIEDNKINKRNLPVKRFQVKWYIWLIHYIWAIWVIFKIFIYMTIFYSFLYLRSKFWKDIWKVLIEYWNLRLPIFIFILEFIWFIYFWGVVMYRISLIIYKDKRLWIGKFYRFIKISKFLKWFRVYISKYFIVTDKFKWW